MFIVPTPWVLSSDTQNEIYSNISHKLSALPNGDPLAYKTIHWQGTLDFSLKIHELIFPRQCPMGPAQGRSFSGRARPPQSPVDHHHLAKEDLWRITPGFY